jgi:uncharacterized protein (DUF2336 family)
MALTALDMSSMGRLAQLAANPQGVGRDEIYVAIASLFRAQGAHLTERERLLMREILLKLSRDVEMAVRIALAERLADDEDAPADLILMLCDDRIEVARPVIMRSRKLTDTEILKFVREASVDHQASVAARPNIGEPVTDILARSEAETVLVNLVRNARPASALSRSKRLSKNPARWKACMGRSPRAEICRRCWRRKCPNGFQKRSRPTSPAISM